MIYLDNAATTEPLFFRSDYKQYWFNSNMPYAYTEKRKLQEARDKIKKCLGVKDGLILFFRNATDCANWLANSFGIEFCNAFEHDSVWNSTDWELPIGLYSHQYVNQMTGTIFPIKALNCARNNSRYFVSDFTAAIGHTPIPSNLEDYCDAVWFSGHKFHTEKGIGCLWLGERLCKILEPTESTNNQYGLAHGTEDVAGALMLTDAMESACSNIQNKMDEWEMLAGILLRDLNEKGIDCNYVAQDGYKRTYAINALQFKNINADALATYLETKGIYVGVGHSACSDNNDFRVLSAFGLTNDEASRVIRVSFDEKTTIHDIKALVEGVKDFYNKFVKEINNDSY